VLGLTVNEATPTVSTNRDDEAAVLPMRAEMATARWLRRRYVGIENVAEVAPAGTMTLAGTAAADESELCSETLKPPSGAGPSRRMTPPARRPMTTGFGVRRSADRLAASTFRGAERVVLLQAAARRTAVDDVTVRVFTWKVTDC
jgi:hypothetical protein